MINKQRVLDISGTYQVTKQGSWSLSVPILLAGSWAIPRPTAQDDPPRANGPRFRQDASGLGDIVAMYRHWVFEVEKAPTGNYSIGFGIKFPTGDPHATDLFPDNAGNNLEQRPVDSSIQPGTGGFGVVFDIQGFKQIGSVTSFMSATYLSEPKDKTGVMRNTTPSTTQFYSAPDQYLVRVGGILPIKQVSGLALSVALRAEGVPAKDLIGGDLGFRRPGHSVFIEPGLIYSRGRETWSLFGPVAIERRREANAFGAKGDATFADHMLLFGYSRRFGK